MFYKKAVLNLKICNIHHKKTPVLQSIFNKVAEHKACSVIKKRLQHRCFPGNIAKSLRISILMIICKRLLLPSAYKEFVDIGYENASFDILESAIWLQFIYFFQNFKIAFLPMKHVFRILCVLQYLWLKSAIMENSRHGM